MNKVVEIVERINKQKYPLSSLIPMAWPLSASPADRGGYWFYYLGVMLEAGDEEELMAEIERVKERVKLFL